MSKGNSPERAGIMAALGAEVVLVDQLPGSVPGPSGKGLELVDARAREITQVGGAFRGDQFHHDGN
jgi:cysteine synthase